MVKSIRSEKKNMNSMNNAYQNLVGNGDKRTVLKLKVLAAITGTSQAKMLEQLINAEWSRRKCPDNLLKGQ